MATASPLRITFISLFSGIGGIDLGFERAGMQCIAQVEKDDYAWRVLHKHWPDVPKWRDIHDVGKHNLPPADVVAGGFPCQPHSVAGKRRGAADDRNLWPEMRRIVAELRPAWVVAENVPGIRTTILDSVLSDLETLGYATGTIDVPAVALGAWHIRHRVFIIAHTDKQQHESSSQTQWGQEASVLSGTYADCHGCYREGIPVLSAGGWEQGYYANLVRRSTTVVPNTPGIGRDRGSVVQTASGTPGSAGVERDNPWAVEPGVGRVAYGVPNRVDRLRGLGNAVVPQVAEFIGRGLVRIEMCLRSGRCP